MNIDKIRIGEAPPWDVNVIIEVPFGREPVKYEMDKRSGALYVDRVMHTSMRYPCNYGFVPHTLSEDGDPIDILVASPVEFLSGCIVRCRPIGVLRMKDEKGADEKILAVPVDALILITWILKNIRICLKSCWSKLCIFLLIIKI